MRLLNILFWADFRRSSTNNHTPNKLFIFNDALFLCIIFPASDTKKHAFRAFFVFHCLKTPYYCFLRPALFRRKPPFWAVFSIFFNQKVMFANYLIFAAFLAALATFPTFAVSDFNPLVNSASSTSPIFSAFTLEQQ